VIIFLSASSFIGNLNPWRVLGGNAISRLDVEVAPEKSLSPVDQTGPALAVFDF
jgi:hypothetical protein